MGGWREQRVATQPAGPHSRSEGCGVWCALLMGDTKLPWDSVQFGLRLSPIQSDQRGGTSPSPDTGGLVCAVTELGFRN